MEQNAELRSSGIGGSDIAIIAGLSKWSTPYELYLKKIEKTEEPDNAAFYWGRILESVVADEYARRTGKKIRVSNKTYRDKKEPWLMAHVDRLIQGEKRILECKTTRFADSDEWGEQGSDKIPVQYLMQTQHYLEVLNYEIADLAVLISGSDYRIYTIPRDRQIGLLIRKLAKEFWERIEKRNPPNPTTRKDVEKKYPFDSGETVIASQEIIETVQRLKELKIEIKKLESEQDTLEQAITMALGEHSFLVDSFGNEIVSWKSESRTSLDSKYIKEKYPEIAKEAEKVSSFRKLVVRKDKQ